MQNNNVVLVLDLDGTIISINSFKVWYLTLLVYLFFLLRWKKLAVLVGLSAKRAMKTVSRSDIKSYMLTISMQGRIFPLLTSRTVSSVCSFFVRKELTDRVKGLIQHDESAFNVSDVIIASAAPSLYLESIAAGLPYDVNSVIGSGFIAGEYFECFSGNKLEKVNQEVSSLGCSGYIFFTDHHEDIPTAKGALQTFLVSPSISTTKRFIDENITFEVI